VPSHGTIRFCTVPEGILVAESVADGAVHGNFVAHRAMASASLIDGAKAGDQWRPTIPLGLDFVMGAPSVAGTGQNFIDLSWLDTNEGDYPTHVYFKADPPAELPWINDTPGGISGTIHRISSLLANTRYFITIRAYDPISGLESVSGNFRAVTTLS